MVFVTKFDGSRQVFQKEKIIRTCLRMHASREQAEAVANRIENEAYDGITTEEILEKIFNYLKTHRPEVEHQIDLRKAVSLLRPKPDFEMFIQELLKELGYVATANQLVKGKCVEHEIDAIAARDGKTFFVEIKHHLNHHTYTGVDVCLETQARFEDLREGFEAGLNSIKFDRALIVCNTKFSEHAKQYAACRAIELIGWRTPYESGLESLIEDKRFYPITVLKGLDRNVHEKLVENGVILLKQLIKRDVNELQAKTTIPIETLQNLIKKAEELVHRP